MTLNGFEWLLILVIGGSGLGVITFSLKRFVDKWDLHEIYVNDKFTEVSKFIHDEFERLRERMDAISIQSNANLNHNNHIRERLDKLERKFEDFQKDFYKKV